MNDLESEIAALATELVRTGTKNSLTVATAESCTGGMVSAAITDIAGSSAVFDRGYVSYSYPAKIDMIGVDPDTLARHGAVSENVAREMALGVLAASGSDLAVAITGVAGPGSDSDNKPAGLVWFALAERTGEVKTDSIAVGDIGRHNVRRQSVHKALSLLLAGMQRFQS